VKQLQDCEWCDELRARWFSWFLAGAAKHTWQHTFSRYDKMQWDSIVASYRGHYGVHIVPRMAYLSCHELQYNDFYSVQGLLETTDISVGPPKVVKIICRQLVKTGSLDTPEREFYKPIVAL